MSHEMFVKNPKMGMEDIPLWETVRAVCVAAVGCHSLSLTGGPHSGKGMIASRVSGILPETTKVARIGQEELALGSWLSEALQPDPGSQMLVATIDPCPCSRFDAYCPCGREDGCLPDCPPVCRCSARRLKSWRRRFAELLDNWHIRIFVPRWKMPARLETAWTSRELRAEVTAARLASAERRGRGIDLAEAKRHAEKTGARIAEWLVARSVCDLRGGEFVTKGDLDDARLLTQRQSFEPPFDPF